MKVEEINRIRDPGNLYPNLWSLWFTQKDPPDEYSRKIQS